MRISEQLYPRSIVLITTVSKEGKENVMTASFVMPVSFEPKYIAFAISPKRHSFKNLREIPECTVNVASVEMKEAVKICGSYSGKNTDKFKLAKLTKEKSKFVKPSTIKESPISFECKVEEMKEFGDHFIVIGKVLEEYIRKEKFQPLLHYTGDIYMTEKILTDFILDNLH